MANTNGLKNALSTTDNLSGGGRGNNSPKSSGGSKGNSKGGTRK